MARIPFHCPQYMSMSSEVHLPKMHHIGFVVPSIASVIESFCLSVGGARWSKTWHDPIQQVRVAFIYPSIPGDPSIELVEPAAEKASVQKFLERGGGFHHVCYEVWDLKAELAAATARGVTVIRRPQPAVAFDGRRIAWVVTKEKLLIEYLEAVPARSLSGP
jgi:methylmalonyl-CoA/ethylmalonyl-CoA epimerase